MFSRSLTTRPRCSVKGELLSWPPPPESSLIRTRCSGHLLVARRALRLSSVIAVMIVEGDVHEVAEQEAHRLSERYAAC